MKAIRSYKRYPPEGKFDAILIGSGLGSLTCAAMLSRQGKRCLVLEQHYTAGGYTHVFKRPGYEWDVGLHYIGEMGKANSLSKRLFDYVTNGELKWADMGEVYDRIFIGEDEYQYLKGKENWRAKMKEYFPAPEDQKAIDEYLSLLSQVARAGRAYFTGKALPGIAGQAFGWFKNPGFYKFSDRTTGEVLDSITQNPRLKAVLVGQYGDYGLPPAQSSFVMQAMVARHYWGGGFYPVGGSGRIAETIAPVIAESKGEVLVSAEVKRVLLEGKKAVGVEMADGKQFHAPLVISGTGVLNTFIDLVPKELSRDLGILKKLEKVEPSVSHLCLYVGFKENSESLNLPKANYWIYPGGEDHDQSVANYLEAPEKNPFPVVYISFPSAKDPDWENRYPGTSTVEIITLAPYDWYKEWEDKPWKKRGESYETMKEKISQQMLDWLYKKEPQLKGKVDFYELSTPLSTKRFTKYSSGEIYGLNHDPDRFRQTWLKPSTPLKNFWLTGQDIISVGIAGALASGMMTASAILKKNLISEVFDWGKKAEV